MILKIGSVLLIISLPSFSQTGKIFIYLILYYTWDTLFSAEGIQCYTCDKNDLFTGRDTCGDLTQSQNEVTRTCSHEERFCMHVSATKAASSQPSEKMGCAGDLEALLALTGLPAQDFCVNNDAGCHTLPNVPASGIIPELRNIQICCCTKDL